MSANPRVTPTRRVAPVSPTAALGCAATACTQGEIRGAARSSTGFLVGVSGAIAWGSGVVVAGITPVILVVIVR